MPIPGYLYVLQSSASGRQYVGSCLHPERRLGEHARGYVKATAGKGPWIRIALLEFTTAALARKAEFWVKRLRRREYIEMIMAGTFKWPDHFGCVTLVEPMID